MSENILKSSLNHEGDGNWNSIKAIGLIRKNVTVVLTFVCHHGI